MIRRQFIATLAATPLAAALPRPVLAGESPICAKDGLAIGGADAVAYFTDDAYVPGRPDHALMWRGAVWLFDRTETMAAFEMDPTAWCPQFGGYCAYAMSRGIISHSDPSPWLVEDGALYLCTTLLARSLLRRDLPGNLAAARASWPAVLGG
jgi:hypothetical protein